MGALRGLAAGALSLLVVGCAYNAQVVSLDPRLDVVAPEAAAPTGPLVLVVVDDRDGPIVGSRGNAFGSTATIRVEGDVAPRVAHALEAPLTALGFALSEAGSGPELHVTVRAIGYRSRAGAFDFTITTWASVRAEVYNGRDVFTRTYRADREAAELMTPTASRNEALINETMAAALTEMIMDPALVAALTTRN